MNEIPKKKKMRHSKKNRLGIGAESRIPENAPFPLEKEFRSLQKDFST